MTCSSIFKYRFEFEQVDELRLNEWEKIEKVRARLFCLGLFKEKDEFGSISFRKKINSFIITSKKTNSYPKLTSKYYCLVKKVDFSKQLINLIGVSKADFDTLIHASLYRLDLNINAVIFTQNKKLLNYMKQNDYLGVNSTKQIKSKYENIDVLLNNCFYIQGEFEGVVTFGKSLKDAEKSLYSIIQKLLT